MGESLSRGFRIGEFTVSPSQGRIVSSAGEVHVEPRAMDVLVALACRPAETLTRDELIEAVWKHPHVSDEALSRCISVLRHALRDDGSRARLIETIPKRGYRLTAPVEIVAQQRAQMRVNGREARRGSGESGDIVLPDWSRTNVALQLTRIIGRDAELGEVRSLLAEQRLVTLTGSAGVGKTRLALELGKLSLPEFADGVWLVELAPLSDPALVPANVATVLGVELSHTASPSKELARRVAYRELLLILDNCEHLVDAVASLAETVLGTAPGVRVLATSQVLINIAGEQAYRVPSLAVPDEARLAPDDVMSAAAVQLFVERATSADSRFGIHEGNAAPIAAICRRLDGIPLAIEMAAARAPLLGVEHLAQLLDERFRVLTGGRRTALPRQQTLRATLDWSYNLLPERERTVLARFGVFAGGFTIEAACAVAADDTIDKVEVIDLLARLISRSLVVADADDRMKRYRLLQSTRDYALERLDESGETERIRTRHLDYYLSFAEWNTPNNGNDQAQLLGVLHPERENFLAAHAWCDRAEHGGAAGLRLAFALKDYWVHRGGLDPGYRVTVDALARPGAQQRDVARCRALYTGALLGTCLGRPQEVQRYRKECLSIARDLGDARLIVFALLSLGEHFYLQRQWQEARRYIEEAVAMARASEPAHGLHSALLALADLNRIEGNLDAAERLYAEGLALSRSSGEQRFLVVDLVGLATVTAARGDAQRAQPLLREALAVCEDVGSKPLGSVVLLIGSGLAASNNEWQCAAELYGAATRHCEDTGYRPEPADEAFVAPLVERTRNALGVQFAEAESFGRTLSYESAMAQMRTWLTA